MRLYRPVMDQYQERYDPGMFLDTLPANGQDAFRLFKEKSRWTHYW
jgi:hypothetical protein